MVKAKVKIESGGKVYQIGETASLAAKDEAWLVKSGLAESVKETAKETAKKSEKKADGNDV